MKKYFLIALVILLPVLIVGTYLAVEFSSRHSVPGGRMLITILEGQSAREIGSLLEDKGLPVSPGMFSLAAVITGTDKNLDSGTYELGPDFTILGLLETFEKGKGYSVEVRLLEGGTMKEFAGRLSSKLGLSESVFQELGTDSAFVDSLVPGSVSLEGFLYPDTYSFPVNTTERMVLKILVHRFDRVFDELTENDGDSTGLSKFETVILASIIEKEAKVPMERRLISGVFHNRLKIGRPIESCATIRFILDKPTLPLTYQDLSAQSPYNTYINRGLPPGPISNPGRASLEAALHPAEVDYLYFVARGDGSHIFSKNLTDHNRAKENIKNGRSNRRPEASSH